MCTNNPIDCQMSIKQHPFFEITLKTVERQNMQNENNCAYKEIENEMTSLL